MSVLNIEENQKDNNETFPEKLIPKENICKKYSLDLLS